MTSDSNSPSLIQNPLTVWCSAADSTDHDEMHEKDATSVLMPATLASSQPVAVRRWTRRDRRPTRPQRGSGLAWKQLRGL